MKVKHSAQLKNAEKEFLNLFQKLSYNKSSWQIWDDLMNVMACSISNAVDRTPKHYEEREKLYAHSIQNLGSVEVPAQMLGILVMALEENPEQDFLGAMYMQLNLGSHWHGQFFTPYHVCKAMSEITVTSGNSEIDIKGYISVCDPACGAGATLIAAANTFSRLRKNYQNHVLFVAQDVDPVVAKMCYIQLSLLGCAGYICVGNSLTNPLTGHPLFPNECEGQDLWYTPVFFTQVWTMRRMFHGMALQCGTGSTKKPVEKEQFTYFFEFEKEETA